MVNQRKGGGEDMNLAGWGIFGVACLVIASAGIILFTTPPKRREKKTALALSPMLAGFVFNMMPDAFLSNQPPLHGFALFLKTIFPFICIVISLVYIMTVRKQLDQQEGK